MPRRRRNLAQYSSTPALHLKTTLRQDLLSLTPAKRDLRRSLRTRFLNLNKKRIEIVYFSQSRKKQSKRLVDPYRIWFFNGTFYLIGLCHVREEVRIFALDRIKMLSQTDESFEIPEDFNLEEFVKPSFGVFQGKPTKVKIWFSAEIAGYIKEKIWHESQEILTQNDGSIVFEAEVAGTNEIRFWVMSWGSQAEVIEPKLLRDEIRIEAEAMLAHYSRGVDQITEPSPPFGKKIEDR